MAAVSYFYIYRDPAGQWRWRFSAQGGKCLAMSPEGYDQRADCERAVEQLKRLAAASPAIVDDASARAHR